MHKYENSRNYRTIRDQRFINGRNGKKRIKIDFSMIRVNRKCWIKHKDHVFNHFTTIFFQFSSIFFMILKVNWPWQTFKLKQTIKRHKMGEFLFHNGMYAFSKELITCDIKNLRLELDLEIVTCIVLLLFSWPQINEQKLLIYW